ncbi:MAG: hypothetical protein AAGA68_22445 [Pseudomonadota bacterium]
MSTPLAITPLLAVLRFDGLRVLRDRFLLSMTAYVIALTVGLRWFLPWLTQELDTRLNFDFTPYIPLLASHLLVQVSAQLGGMVAGLLLLESREDSTVKALLVTPIPIEQYLAVLGGAATVVTVMLATIEAGIIGWGVPDTGGLLIAVAVGAPGAMIFALLVPTLADDKMQAFAYMKLLGLLPLAATVAWFIPTPWQALFALYPPYCGSKIYWLVSAGEGGWGTYAVLGLVGAVIWVWGLSQLFLRVARG